MESTSIFPPPWDRVAAAFTRWSVWALMFAVLYLLRSFSLLIFLTFVFAYIQSRGVERLKSTIQNRPSRVVIVGLALLGVLVSFGAYVVPSVRDQATIFAASFPSYIRSIDQELVKLSDQYPILREVIPQLPALEEQPVGEHKLLDPKRSASASLLQVFREPGDGGTGVAKAVDALRNIGGVLIAIGSAFMLSLLFSFLIVLDLPKLTRSVRSLADSKIGFVYEEVADSIAIFGRTIGRAIEAQLVVALLNTFLTFAGILFMGLGEKAAFLSLIVFVCSFVPVAGVFISSLPICLMALQRSGPAGLFEAIGLITGVHLVETYILNPRIYGHHLRMNPVIVLIILTIAGKLFHVWGLILGVPVCNYIFTQAIRFPKER